MCLEKKKRIHVLRRSKKVDDEQKEESEIEDLSGKKKKTLGKGNQNRLRDQGRRMQ